jgi:zinc and cadmium transporter
MTSFFRDIVIYSGMIAVSVIVGGLIPLFFSWSRRQLHILLAFSAGMMLSVTMIHLLPTAFELLGSRAALYILSGFLFLYLLDKFVTMHICEAFECDVHSIGPSAFVGMTAHAITDGVALGSGLLIDQMAEHVHGGAVPGEFLGLAGLGLVVFLTIFFHKLPESFSLTTILMHESRMNRGKIFIFNLLMIVTIPLGASLSLLFVGQNGSSFPGMALAFSAGVFLHMSLSDLLPHVHEHAEAKMPVVVSFLIGLATVIGIDRFFGHG